MTARSGTGGTGEDARRIVEEAARRIEALGGLSDVHAGAECRYCPVCRLLATLRELRPEVVDHLSVAAEELLAAAREFSAPARAGGPDGPGDDGPGVPDGGEPREPWVAAARAGSTTQPVVQHIEITD